MYLSSILATAGLCVAAAVPRQADDACTNPPKRVEWRTLSANAQKHYIDSVLCLTTKPSGLGHAKTSRYDDFTWVHTNLDKESTWPPYHYTYALVLGVHLTYCVAASSLCRPISPLAPPLRAGIRGCAP